MQRQRTAAPAPRCSFSDLPSPVAAHIFSLLSNDDRLPVLDVCTAWHAIIDAGGPALWPTAVIKGPMDIAASIYDQAGIDAARRPALYDCSFHQGVLDKAAGLSLRLRSLFVDADGTQPEVILSILAIVPAVSLVCLSIKGRCPGPLPLVLQRFRQLQRVELTGDASWVSWEGPGGTWLAGMVCSLDLAPVTVDGGSIIGNDLCLSPDRAAHLGAALSQLTRLAITVCWDDDTSVPALVAALPSLQAFSLCVRGICEPPMSASVVKLLVRLPQHVAVDLTMTRETHSDWLQLSRLRALTLHDGHLERVAPIEHAGTWLTQLQLHMSSGDVAPALASLTSLQSLRLESCGDMSCSLPASLTALTALTFLELRQFSLPTVPAPVPDMTSLRTLVMEPSPVQMPAGRYLEGLQELRGCGYMYSRTPDLPPSLALATCLRRLELNVPDNNNMSSNASLLAALPALRAVTLMLALLSCSKHSSDLKQKLQALRPDIYVTSLDSIMLF
ncbi:hypothetical protein D9Q98_009793 [Chlorella vulgaris]|uniref:F-box domain-containing protein n=1 Tax=Chlorella vulgaris TaxID=3077 RepID=A0A9D4TF22_CHLVU|nr:hypothetical protein D9Q98_009793 [Chlorella vulgaris]